MQGGYCVKVYKSNVSRSEASATCARDGGHLYKVGSVEDKQVFADPKVTGETGWQAIRFFTANVPV